MRSGILEALRPLRAESQRQIVLVTDGQIGSETEVVHAIAHAAAGVVAACTPSASGRASTARSPGRRRAPGAGVEVVIGLGEDPERAARAVGGAHQRAAGGRASSSRGARCCGDRAPRARARSVRRRAVAGGAASAPEGGDARGARAHGATGRWRSGSRSRPSPPRAAAARWWRSSGARRSRISSSKLATGRATARAIDARSSSSGSTSRSRTRLTSWVAVSDEVTVDPQAPTRRESMPQRAAVRDVDRGARAARRRWGMATASRRQPARLAAPAGDRPPPRRRNASASCQGADARPRRRRRSADRRRLSRGEGRSSAAAAEWRRRRTTSRAATPPRAVAARGAMPRRRAAQAEAIETAEAKTADRRRARAGSPETMTRAGALPRRVAARPDRAAQEAPAGDRGDARSRSRLGDPGAAPPHRRRWDVRARRRCQRKSTRPGRAQRGADGADRAAPSPTAARRASSPTLHAGAPAAAAARRSQVG